QFSRPRPSGLIAIDLEEGNTLVGAAITNGSSDIMLCSNAAKAARFKETDVRTMGRTAKGVRGIRLGEGQRVISLIIPNEEGYLLTASENGYGKRSLITDFPIRGRGAQGVIAMQTSNRNGELVGAVQVFKGDELMLISNMGTLVRTGGDEVSIVGRNTQGVRLIKLKDGELLNSVGRIAEGSLVADTEGSDGDLSEGEKSEGEKPEGEKSEGVVDGGGIDAATPADDSDTESE
ncbi:DNA gyrase subunit A, partial [Pseudomonadales bacterium]|nr:DNA gyrase subunit A [Pseudomonadales bacterium]